MSRTIENVPVWLTTYSSPEAIRSEEDHAVVGATTLHFPWRDDAKGPEGWTLCGVATVTYEFSADKEIMANKVDSLRSELEKDRADSELRQNAILNKISKLESLEWSGEVEA